MAGQIPDKVLAPLAGEPVLVHAARALVATERIEGFVVTVRDSEQEAAITAALAASGLDLGRCQFVAGGAERCHSVLKALEACPSHIDAVLIHDAARPLVTTSAILRLIEAMQTTGAAVLARPVVDTLKRSANEVEPPVIGENLARDGLWAVETPQAFLFPAILAAYRKSLAEGHLPTDDTAPLHEAGGTIQLVANDTPNPKITVPSDLAWAEFLLQKVST